jgi:hypothetical protein
MARRYIIAPQDRIGLSRIEAADYIGVLPAIFDKMVLDGRMPPAKLINNCKVWSRARVEKAFDNLSEDSQSELNTGVWDDIE